VPIPPCYFIVDTLSTESVVVDCGTGPEADLSQALIGLFGCRCYGLEPTRKHFTALDRVVAATANRFTYVSRAVAVGSRQLTFYESTTNRSGSVLSDHVNVRRDETLRYEVETVTIDGLFNLLGIQRIDLLKVDIEGAEYEVLSAATPGALSRVGQLIVEFHDHCVPRYTTRDTRRLVRKLQSAGFLAHCRDGINFLFFRPPVLAGRSAV